MKLIEVNAAKEFASTFLNDIFFRMAVNMVLDAAPGFDLVRCKECKYSRQAEWYRAKLRCTHPSCMASQVPYEVPQDHFCSYGERKTE